MSLLLLVCLHSGASLKFSSLRCLFVTRSQRFCCPHTPVHQSRQLVALASAAHVCRCSSTAMRCAVLCCAVLCWCYRHHSVGQLKKKCLE